MLTPLFVVLATIGAVVASAWFLRSVQLYIQHRKEWGCDCDAEYVRKLPGSPVDWEKRARWGLVTFCLFIVCWATWLMVDRFLLGG